MNRTEDDGEDAADLEIPDLLWDEQQPSPAIASSVNVDHRVLPEEVEQRLDHCLSARYPEHSRARWQKAIQAGQIRVGDKQAKPSHRLREGEHITGELVAESATQLEPASIALDILYSDEHLVVVNKPAHLIVHPGKANYGGTLANALVHHFQKLSATGGAHRPGIVHRLDRDTTGVIAIALDNATHEHLSAQFADRTVKKEYRAIVWGEIEYDSDLLETWVRPHSKHREKMVVCGPDPEARQALTFYEVLRRYRGFTYMKLLPKTGRTHQLRVHMQYMRHPIVADRLYGGQPQLTLFNITDSREHLAEDRILIQRQALHAYRLQLTHPHTGERLEFIAPLPQDMQQTLDALDAQT